MKLQLPKGTRDFGTKEKIIREKVVNTLKKSFELYGFPPLETPIIERFDVLSSKYTGGAEILKETFKLNDQGERDLGLRYDLTVPLARYVGMNPNLKMPFKRYQIGEVFRDGPVAQARYRQFTQCDVDVVGSKSLMVEAEIIALIYDAFKEMDLPCVVKVNNRKLLNSILDYCGIEKEKQDSVILSVDKLEKIGKEGVTAEIKKYSNIEESKIEKLMEIINVKGTNDEKVAQLKNLIKDSDGLKEIEELLNYTKTSGTCVDFDVSLARGLSYYTGTVIETFFTESKIKSAVCAGGRYDNMIGSLLEKGQIPAMGVSFGLDRIYDALKEKENSNETNTKVFVVPIKTTQDSFKIVNQLRENKINAEIDLMGRNISKNLDYANALGIPYVLFVGKKEIESKKFKLKNMSEGTEEELSVEEVIKKLSS